MKRLTSLLAALLVCTSTALAQQGTADLRGKVVDQQGAALPGVAIVPASGKRSVPRDRQRGGRHVLHERDDAGRVRGHGRARAASRSTAPRHPHRGGPDGAGRDPAARSAASTESVTVTGESPLVDTTSKEIGGRISAQEFVDTPSFNRNFAGYLGMLPGVVATISATTFGADSISVAGQNVRNVNYTMDGSNNNDTFNGGNGGAQARVPVEAVQEFQLLTSQFDAEYGLASGGIVNSVSKSGTNRYHGSAFVLPGREARRARLFRQEGGPREGRHQAAAVGRHARRSDRPRQGALLRAASSASCSTAA